jgi:hypothetical protein
VRIPWSIDAIPELRSFPPEERRRIWRQQSNLLLFDPLVILAALAAGCCGALGKVVACELWGGRVALVLGVGVGAAIGGGLFGLYMSFRVRNRIAKGTS